MNRVDLLADILDRYYHFCQLPPEAQDEIDAMRVIPTHETVSLLMFYMHHGRLPDERTTHG